MKNPRSAIDGFGRRHFALGVAASLADGLVLAGCKDRQAPPSPAASIAHDPLFRNPYLNGDFAPVFDELDVRRLPVRGAIPKGLRGAYLRNGPNPAFEPRGYMYPLDGDGMIHAVTFDDGFASYKNRFVRTKGFLAEQRVGRAIYGGALDAEGPDTSALAPAEIEPTKNVANTNIIRHGDKLLALYEAGQPYEITPTLDTRGPEDFAGRLRGAMTAHPRLDHATGELHFFRYGAAAPHLVYYRADRAGQLVTQVPIVLPRPVMMHDAAITERWVVFVECPVVFGRGLEWRPEFPTRFGLLSRAAPEGGVRWFEAPPFFVFHIMNAFDEGERVHVDLVWRQGFGRGAPTGPEARHPHLRRYTIDLAASAIKDDALDDRVVEFPRLDDRATGRPYALGYAAARIAPREDGRPSGFDGLLQFDAAKRTTVVRGFGPGWSVGEAVFAPVPGKTGERDGFVLCFAHDGNAGKSHLFVLDPAAFTSEPVAVVDLPRRIPSGLHGNWIPGLLVS